MIHRDSTHNKEMKEDPGSGFSRLKPKDGQDRPPKKYDLMTSHYFDFVCKSGPFSFFITLTFPWGTSKRACCQFTSQYLKMHNKRLFGRDYYKKSDFLTGFAFVEDHKNREEKHVHLLIKPHKRFEDFILSGHLDIFQKAALNVKKTNDRQVFNKKCIDFQPYKDEGAVKYCFKHIHDRNLSRIKIIGQSGLTDTLDEF